MGYLIFLFLIQNIHCGYSLEPPLHFRVPTMYVLNKNIKNIKNFPMKLSIFGSEKILHILHGQVFVMQSTVRSSTEC